LNSAPNAGGTQLAADPPRGQLCIAPHLGAGNTISERHLRTVIIRTLSSKSASCLRDRPPMAAKRIHHIVRNAGFGHFVLLCANKMIAQPFF
jgi:hypothetical protein